MMAPGPAMSGPLPPPFGRAARTHLCFWGRGAIWSALKLAGLGPGDTALLPAYHCGAEVDPFVRRGVSIRFYEVGRSLRVDADALRPLVERGTRVLFITHYFGFPQPIDEIVSFCREHDLILIEDCAHALYGQIGGRDLGTFGDFAVFSVRKTLPTPGGAALLVNRAAFGEPDPSSPPPLGRTLGLAKGHLENHLIVRYGRLGRLAVDSGIEPLVRLSKAFRRPGNGEAGGVDHARDLFYDERQGAWGMAALAERVLRAADPRSIREARRRNFSILLQALGDLRNATPLFTGIPEGVCPLFFPLLVEDPARLRSRLSGDGIEATVFWSLFHPILPRQEFREAVYLKTHVLGLPVHQGMTADEAEAMAARVRDSLTAPSRTMARALC